MKLKLLFLSVFFPILAVAQTDVMSLKENYLDAYRELDSMLNGTKAVSFKRAVFVTENAYLNNRLDYDKFNEVIFQYVELSEKIIASRKLLYDKQDKPTIEKLAAVFTLMTDTIPVMLDTNVIVQHLPFTYDFEDIFGDVDWSKMFVTKLLLTRKGNCHSMPFLYKIICEDMGVNAQLAQAPNHFYIKYRSEKDGWYNTELTSGFFPLDAWLFASGYITLDAVRNGIYMDTLSLKQSLAVCMLDLAKGYEHKFNANGDRFIIRCCDKALEYYPNFVGAQLMKAETLKKRFEQMMKDNGTNNPNEILKQEKPRELFAEMEQIYANVYRSGYRTMPDEMYIKWLMSLRTEAEKYINPKIYHKIKQGK
jgi:hypothetical protein